MMHADDVTVGPNMSDKAGFFSPVVNERAVFARLQVFAKADYFQIIPPFFELAEDDNEQGRGDDKKQDLPKGQMEEKFFHDAWF
jgi:hypothetical protein